jgi:hypothetical protein
MQTRKEVQSTSGAEPKYTNLGQMHQIMSGEIITLAIPVEELSFRKKAEEANGLQVEKIAEEGEMFLSGRKIENPHSVYKPIYNEHMPILYLPTSVYVKKGHVGVAIYHSAN